LERIDQVGINKARQLVVRNDGFLLEAGRERLGAILVLLDDAWSKSQAVMTQPLLLVELWG